MNDWGEGVLALEPTFRRAPSAHNTQPWTLRAEGDALALGWDPARELHVGDPTRRDLWLSVGAFAESLVVAAASAGVGVGVEWDVSTRRSIAGRLVEQQLVTGLFTSANLVGRHSARGPYAAPWATAADVHAVAAAADLTETGASLTVVPGTDVDDLLPDADRWSCEPPALVDELRHWLRLDHGDPRYREDGLSDVALALTAAQARSLRVALSSRVWPLLRRAGGPSVLGAASKIAGRGTVVAFHAPVDRVTRRRRARQGAAAGLARGGYPGVAHPSGQCAGGRARNCRPARRGRRPRGGSGARRLPGALGLPDRPARRRADHVGPARGPGGLRGPGVAPPKGTFGVGMPRRFTRGQLRSV